MKFILEPRDYRDLRIALIDDPDGVRIELVQPKSEQSGKIMQRRRFWVG